MGLLVAAALATSTATDRSRTFLASVVNVPLKRDEALKSFAFETWGIRFKVVCHIPEGWAIKAGGSVSPEGVFSGEGSQGITWYRTASPADFRNLVLVELSGPIQRRDVRLPNGLIPATFKGIATLSTDGVDRTVRLSADNIRLIPAGTCRSR